MNIIQITSIVSMLCCVLLIVVASRRKSWAEAALFACLLLLSGVRYIPLPYSVWVLSIVSALAVVLALVRARQAWKDPEWRASWKR